MPPTFAQLGVPKPIDRALARRGITRPFEIQTATLADAMAGRDVCGRAPTGSGKTLAFGIPLVARARRAEPRKPNALVLAPTRELADQIMSELRSFSGKVRVAVVYGGVGYGPQIRALRGGADILVSCPGRLEDLIQQGFADLSAVEIVVIDEADRMADMGFIPAVRRLLDQTTTKRQTMLFSATLDNDVASLTRDYQHHPVRHDVGKGTRDVVQADHVFWNVARTNRIEVSARAIDATGPTIVFCRTRRGSDRVARQLSRKGILTAAIHGGRNQNQRTRALNDFASGRVQALVATDVVARGIHVEDVSAIIHYDLPADHKAYLHRSGRTARAGRDGIVVSLVPPDQVKELRAMQRRLGLRQQVTDVDLTAIQPLDGKARRRKPRGAPSGPSRQPTVRGRQHGSPGRPASKNGSRKPRSNHKRKASKSRNKRAPAGARH
ncbi:DEAD/DEAH box helicase [Candidatus Spongiisocius sp.]|uniref:DEAD/DEAH box helicase n=1 Tax=Candidatus Spongiisocius sp. TaxID=3101273 RepID=UPI003B5A6B36